MTKVAVKPKPKMTRVTPKQWAEAEALWESGEVTLEDLVNKFGKSLSTFKRHFDKMGVVKGSKKEALKKRVAEEVVKAAIDDATITAARIRETKEEHYKMATGLAKLTWGEILKTKQDGAPVAVATNNLKALDLAMSVLKKAREERWAVLGLDRVDAVDGNELPELVISELTADQIQELRDRDNLEMDEPTKSNGVAGDDEVVEEEDD